MSPLWNNKAKNSLLRNDTFQIHIRSKNPCSKFFKHSVFWFFTRSLAHMSPDAYKAWLASRKVKFIFRTLENCWNRVFVFVFYFCVCFKHSKIVVTKPLVFFSISGSVSNSRKLFESSMCVLHSIFVSVCSLLLFMFWTLKFFWTYCLFSFWTAIFYLSVC